MTVDRIGSIDPIQNNKKVSRTEALRQKGETDSVSLSTEAVEKGDLYQAIEIVSSAPDVRADKIAALREKMNDPAYLNDKIINDTAEKIIDLFGL
ncbi:MAG: flagellar biosynthesis anti-sigma factor FlgM [Termitinemataceae bacterium]